MKDILDRIAVNAPGWGRSLEWSASTPVEGEITQEIHVPDGTKVLVLTASGSLSGYEPPQSLFLELANKEQGALTQHAVDNADVFVGGNNGRVSVVVVNNPLPGSWLLTFRVSKPSLFRVNFATFKEHFQLSQRSRCKLCKLLMAALAGAIIAAIAHGAMAAALPAALMAAIAAVLGPAVLSYVLAALLIIRSWLIDDLAEKLCQEARICPG